jgi:hypothetical protein
LEVSADGLGDSKAQPIVVGLTGNVVERHDGNGSGLGRLSGLSGARRGLGMYRRGNTNDPDREHDCHALQRPL